MPCARANARAADRSARGRLALTAVTANAEAALKFLKAPSPPLDELRDTLTDIRNDNQRAGDVVRRMRTLLKKEATQHEPFDVDAAVSDVVKLIKGNAVSRHIAIDLELAADLAPVVGDRTQFQQVLLNLLLNACDAVQNAEPSERRISLRAEQMTYLVGFVFLFAFIIWVSGFDLVRTLGGAPPPQP